MLKKIVKNKKYALLVFLGVIISITSWALTYGSFNTSKLDGTEESGIDDNVVYVNDLKSDYYYYTGQNYTHSSDGRLPSLNDKNIYNDSNLVKATITYYGKDYNNNNLKGSVSISETQDTFIYYKFYPKKDGYINIELIDNPFSNHPNNKTFNGWITDYKNAYISYDDDYYTRYLKVPVTSDEVSIDVYASWTDGVIKNVTSLNSLTNTISTLPSKGMQAIETREPIYSYHMEGLYTRDTIRTTTVVSGRWAPRTLNTTYGTCTDCYDSSGNYYTEDDPYQCPIRSGINQYSSRGTYNNDCTVYYAVDSNSEYDEDATYYHLNYGRFSEATDVQYISGYQSTGFFGNNDSTSGYYIKRSKTNGQDISGFYDSSGVVQSGTCNRTSCEVYELVQFYDSSGNKNVLDLNSDYYYLTTRDTNVLVMTNNISYSNNSVINLGTNDKPFTLTGINNGTDYESTFTISGGNSYYTQGSTIVCQSDIRIENMKISSIIEKTAGTDIDYYGYTYLNTYGVVPTSTNTRGAIFGNYHNLKIGRGITANGSNTTFFSVVGGYTVNNNDMVGSSSDPKKFKLEIESGVYNTASLLLGASTSSSATTLYAEAREVYGSDYDRVNKDNSNLELYFSGCASWGGNLHSSNDTLTPIAVTTVKSGEFGSSKYDLATGLYVGGRYGGTHYAPRVMIIEGGYIYNVTGGPGSDEDKTNLNDIFVYMKGGLVDNITGGAGTSTTAGNRITQVTGGKVNYSIFAGSNGVSGQDGEGVLTGSTYVYVGGDATIGDDDLIEDKSTLWGAASGTVFGAGNGNSDYDTIGSVDNSNIVIADEAKIKGNVYGSGNYGTVGYNGNNDSTTNIKVVGGTVSGNVFGSGNQSGSGKNSTNTTINIEVTGGSVSGGVYGGSNAAGTVYGSTNVKLVNGTVNDVFGGGLGSNTYVSKNTNVVIGDDTTTNLNVTGTVYGGSSFGTVNLTTKTTNKSSYTTKVTINNGTVNQVFGGGKGDDDNLPYVGGDVTVTVNGGTVTDLFGGNNASGQPNGKVSVYLNSGKITNVYGGGNNTGVDNTYIYQKGSNVTTIYGGSNAKGDVTSSNIEITGGTSGTVYGGNNKGGNTTTTNIRMSNGSVTTLYGGGALTDTQTTNVNITGGTVDSIYGGGESASVSDKTNVIVDNGNIKNIYGGSNSSGTVKESNVVINGTGNTITAVYGGNNAGGTTQTTSVKVKGGNITDVYGGGALTSSGTTNVTIDNGTVNSVYGGGKSADVTTKTNVTFNSGTITGAIYGGSNSSGTVKETLVNINGNVPTVYGGNNAGGTTTTSNVYVNNGTVTDVYGGNNAGGTTTTSNVYLNKGTITNAYGGGNNAETHVSNITLNGSTATNIYGGGKSAGVNTTHVNMVTGKATSVYGGSNSAGTVDESNVITNNASNLSVTNVYGGNNAGGKTKNAKINMVGGTYTDIYGGGNNADTDYTTVFVDGINVTGDFFGGGNNANVNFNTNVQFTNSTISGDIFGGGNLGEILGNSTVKISHSNINGSAYAGGNGATAIVYGNTNISVENASVIGKHVFGGGNAANTGTDNSNSSVSNVNIAGGTIHGNVYGGANTAVLYGTAIVNVGGTLSGLTKSDIQIDGTVFGGGEANASGSSTYDFSFIGVTKAIEVNIDGEGYNNFNIDGSIFGSGNASSTSGTSEINISNYGTFDDYKENVSIQRTDTLTIKNSAIKLSGATDRTNEFSDVEFSISRVKKLVLANDSTLFLDTGANLLESFYSQKITGSSSEKAKVTITDSGNTTRNVNNRIYMLEGKNLNIATNENATATGRVSGMTFFGMYKLGSGGKVITGLYDNAYKNGDAVSGGALYAFTLGSYVKGTHHDNHDIEVDGFYSNYADKDNEGHIKTAYIEPSPPDANFYRWAIGEQVTTYEVTLAASKYATLGTYELPLEFNSDPNTTFQILGFNYDDLEEGFELALEKDIPRINNEGTADTKMGLKIEPSNTGFLTTGSTSFVTDNENPVVGTKSYTSENSTAQPSLLFYLYHSKNISLSREIGTVVISMQAVTPVDELNSSLKRVNINVTLTSALFNSNDYEGAMTTGEKYNMFASSPTNINTKSTLSAYYSLFMKSDNSYYQNGYHHSLVSSFVFPAKTKITMLDLIDDETYYYVVDDSMVAKATEEYNLYRECSYDLDNFIKMGSTSPQNKFDESKNANKYYNSSAGVVDEEFIFIVNFEDANINENKLNNTLLMELRNGSDNTLISVLGIQHSALTYNMYNGSNAIVDISGELGDNVIYIGDTATLNLTGNFTQPIVNTLPVVDTSHFNKKPGIKMTIYDKNGNQLNNSSLLGISYEVDGISYYPRMDGSVRIALADKVANIFKYIKINTSNLNLASGDYTLKVESFTSPDGIYYGHSAQDTLEIPFTIINSTYGLKVKLTDEEMMINKLTGLTLNNDNALNFKVDYSSSFENPNIHVALYRRKYDDVYSYEYTKVNLASYVTNNLQEISNSENDYMFIPEPTDGMTKALYLKSSLVSGTYKFVFSLYDGDVYIGDVCQYIIIK